jgi:folate-binding protein YgfZ
MVGVLDESRGFLEISGGDARSFLQNLITNDVEALAPDKPLYAALLTPQGKYLFDFFLIDLGGSILLDADAARLPQLAQRLTMYKLRSDVTLTPGDWRVALAPDGDVAAPEGGAAVDDPRDGGLGRRIYWRATVPSPEGLSADLSAYDQRRVQAGVPATDLDLIADETYILEAGFDRLNGVSFTKGCYVGQEVTARMRHKTELRKGLKRVRVDGAAEAGAEITVDGKPAGVLRSRIGDEALAHLRFDRAKAGEMTAGAAKVSLIDPV